MRPSPDVTQPRRPDPRRAGEPMLDRLEPRVLLSDTPFPDVSLLEDPGNAVLRLETTLGTIDIELFQGAAPATLGNLLAAHRDGGLDRSIFHRLVPGRVLEMGAYTYYDALPHDVLWPSPLSTSGPHDLPDDPFTPRLLDPGDPSREPLQWTVSLSEFAEFLPSHVPHEPPRGEAVASLVFNLTDHPDADQAADFDTIYAGSRVIGRIMPGASRDVAALIAGLETSNLRGSWPGTQIGRFAASAPTLEPVAPFDSAHGSQLVIVTDAELIKPQGSGGFFEHRLFYPEGFAGETISEFVPIVNPNDEPAQYQLIARFEIGGAGQARRDLVIESGTIAGNSRGGVTISRASDPGAGLVPAGRPYALELRSTLPLGATLSHYDFGAATGESFTSEAATVWHFADTVVEEGCFAFLVWQNTSEVDAAVRVLLYPENAAADPIEVPVPTSALRRGGLNLSQMNLPEGRYGIRVSSDQPIVAALSQYDNRGQTRAASTELGVPQTLARGGALPIARPGGSVTMFNPADPRVDHVADPTASVTLTLTPADPNRAPVQRSFTVAAGRLVRYDFADAADELGAGPFSIEFVTDNEVVLRASRGVDGDDAATPFAVGAAERWVFAEGFMDPARAGADVFETLGVFNTVGLPAVQNEVTVTFWFTDGASVSEVFSLAPGRHLLLDLHTFTPLLDEAAAGRNFYGIEVASQFPVVAQLWHDDPTLGGDTPAGGFGTIGDPMGLVTLLNTSPTIIVAG